MQGEEAGQFNPAGAPEISARFERSADYMSDCLVSATGAFSAQTKGVTWLAQGGGWNSAFCNVLNFSASKANNIYGSSDSIIPKSSNTPLVIYLGI